MRSKIIDQKDLEEWVRYVELRGRFIQALTQYKNIQEAQLKKGKELCRLAEKIRHTHQVKQFGWQADLAKEIRKWAAKNH